MFSTMPMTGTLMRRNMASAFSTSSSATSWGVVTSSGAADGHGLGEGQLRIRGARRQVDHEVVELAPVDIAQELLDGATDERAAPHDGLALGHEELDGDDLDAVALEGRDLALGAGGGRAFDAHHQRDVGTRDVRVEQADAGAVHAPATTARFADTVLLPTPPLPEATAMMFLTPGTSDCGWCRAGAADHGAPGDGRRRSRRAPRARRGCCASISSLSGQAGVVSSILSDTSSSRRWSRP